MRDYPNWTTAWRSSHGTHSIVDLSDGHLAGIIDFLRWDAAKELGLVGKAGPGTFDFSAYDTTTRRRITSLIQAKVPMWWTLRAEALKRGLYTIMGNCKTQVQVKETPPAPIDPYIETRKFTDSIIRERNWYPLPTCLDRRKDEGEKDKFVSHKAHVDLETRVTRLECTASRLPAEERANRRLSELVERVEKIEVALHRIAGQVASKETMLTVEKQIRLLFRQVNEIKEAAVNIGIEVSKPDIRGVGRKLSTKKRSSKK